MAVPTSSSRVITLRTVLLCGGVVRLCLLVWGEWQDHHLPVPYTDIDYGVFSDGALLIAQGASPYERITYRYSPLVLAAHLTHLTSPHPAHSPLTH